MKFLSKTNHYIYCLYLLLDFNKPWSGYYGGFNWYLLWLLHTTGWIMWPDPNSLSFALFEFSSSTLSYPQRFYFMYSGLIDPTVRHGPTLYERGARAFGIEEFSPSQFNGHLTNVKGCFEVLDEVLL